MFLNITVLKIYIVAKIVYRNISLKKFNLGMSALNVLIRNHKS